MLLEINFTLILFAISFLVFIYLVNLTLYKPTGEIIEKRKGLIEGEYVKARELTDEANKKLEDYKSQIKSAKADAHNIIQEAINNAQKNKEGKISALLITLNKEKEAAVIKIHQEQKIAMKELEDKIKILADLITSKVLGGNKTLAHTH